MSVCLSVSLSVCLSVCLSVFLSVYLSAEVGEVSWFFCVHSRCTLWPFFNSNRIGEISWFLLCTLLMYSMTFLLHWQKLLIEIRDVLHGNTKIEIFVSKFHSPGRNKWWIEWFATIYLGGMFIHGHSKLYIYMLISLPFYLKKMYI